jgi:thiamine pyrophosphokinase
MRWPLDGARLPTGSTRGISNLLTDRQGTVTIDGGVVLVIHERTPSDA